MLQCPDKNKMASLNALKQPIIYNKALKENNALKYENPEEKGPILKKTLTRKAKDPEQSSPKSRTNNQTGQKSTPDHRIDKNLKGDQGKGPTETASAALKAASKTGAG